METRASRDEMMTSLIGGIEKRKSESKKRMDDIRAAEKRTVPVESGSGGGLYYQGREVPGGDSALNEAKEIGRWEAVQSVPAEMVGLTRSYSREMGDPAKSKRLDILERDSKTGRLVNKGEIKEDS